MARIIGRPHSQRRRWTVLICLAGALSVGVFYIAGAQAIYDHPPTNGGVDDTGLLQLDGNTLPGGCGTLGTPGAIANRTTTNGTDPANGAGDDWAALFN